MPGNNSYLGKIRRVDCSKEAFRVVSEDFTSEEEVQLELEEVKKVIAPMFKVTDEEKAQHHQIVKKILREKDLSEDVRLGFLKYLGIEDEGTEVGVEEEQKGMQL